MIRAITIAREYGSGGAVVAHRLGVARVFVQRPVGVVQLPRDRAGEGLRQRLAVVEASARPSPTPSASSASSGPARPMIEAENIGRRFGDLSDGTAMTGTDTIPPTTLGSAPSIPAATTMTRAAARRSLAAISR